MREVTRAKVERLIAIAPMEMRTIAIGLVKDIVNETVADCRAVLGSGWPKPKGENDEPANAG